MSETPMPEDLILMAAKDQYQTTTTNVPEKASGFDLETEFEKQSPERRVLLKVASELLMEHELTPDILGLDNEKLLKKIQEEFQKNLSNHYKQIGLADKIQVLVLKEEIAPSHTPLDEQALNLIAQESQGVHGWVDMLPNLRKLKSGTGFNCTMGSAMLHLALDQLGFKNIRTVLRKGHHVVIREMEKGGVKLYDPTSLSTRDEQLVGYSREFGTEEYQRKQEIQGQGYAFALQSQEEDVVGGITQEQNGEYGQSFFAYEPEIKMDISIALQNLSEIKDDAKKLESDREHAFDRDSYKAAVVEFIRMNNQDQLTDQQIGEIANSHRQPIEEFLHAADEYFEKDGSKPNPFDFISSPLLKPKELLSELPDPKQFTGSSERYEQARELCEKFPTLRQLDFPSIKSALSLFDAHEYLE